MSGISLFNTLSADQFEEFVFAVLGTSHYAAVTNSVVHGVAGIVGAESLTLHRIGYGMSGFYGTDPKHCTKQVDRFLSKSKIDLVEAQRALCRYLIGEQSDIIVALDWTEFDADDHSTLAIYLLTGHGRALPLVWQTVTKSEIAGGRTDAEIELVRRFSSFIPDSVRITMLGDRGFGYCELVQVLHELGMDFVLRIRSNIYVEKADGESKLSGDWLLPSGRARMFKDVRLTAAGVEVESFVAVKKKGMKDPWLLISSLCEHTATQITKLYGKRFRIEETFRDQKDNRFGMGLSATHIRQTHRRDRLLLLCSLAYIFIISLGQAGEAVGLDRILKVNTSKTRQLSLYNQGLRWIGLLTNMRAERKQVLLSAFIDILDKQDFCQLTLDHIVAEK